MQADEDVGKIAMAVPVLVSKALELFLQDLCDRTYDITVQRGAKTVSALHLKHCIHSYNVFDFLREVVNKVPDYGGADAGGDLSKRRKVAGVEVHDSDEDSKRGRMEMCHGTSNVRGRGRGRPRGRGRGLRLAEREPLRHDLEVEPCTSEQSNKQIFSPGRPAENISESPIENLNMVDGMDPSVGTFDLNTGIDDTINKTTMPAAASAVTAVKADAKADECPELSEVDRMVIDPLQVAQMNSQLDEDDEDYDEDG
ncbi:DNA-binding transcription factor [Lithospermum erythrorhizon]|uniref:DNA-binding transcription factor n=1 Tax=Lithospermum erythrorhizon TaxID=34254 RepID=A0AAV3NLP8_LITER